MIKWLFNCPLHGEEFQVLCWRAFDKENVYLWQKVEITVTQLPTSLEESQQYVDRLHAEATEAPTRRGSYDSINVAPTG